MTDKLTITVTADDIAAGLPCSSSRSPIAIAVRRHCTKHVYVGRGYVTADGLWLTLPESAERFRRLYDSAETRGQAQPFTFTLALPAEVSR